MTIRPRVTWCNTSSANRLELETDMIREAPSPGGASFVIQGEIIFGGSTKNISLLTPFPIARSFSLSQGQELVIIVSILIFPI